MIDAAAVRDALAAIPDPELPMVSIVDLGMVGGVDVAPAPPTADGSIRVELLPTFVGCPALDLIRTTVAERLAGFGRPLRIETVFAPPWTADRISPEAIRALAAVGIAGPTDPSELRCPHCGSARVVMDSAFGPTQCRSLHYCRDCRQPFEAMKLV